MRSGISDFPLIGTRDYVHGPSMFETFRNRVLEAAGAPEDTAFSFRFLRVNQTMHTNGTIVVLNAHEPPPDWGRPAAEMSCDAGGSAWYVALYGRDATRITRRESARERSYVGELRLSGTLEGVAELAGVHTQGELFQAVIEANKQVHLGTLTGDRWSATPSFRFVYCLDYLCPPSLAAGAGRVSVRSVGIREAGDYRFSLTALDLDVAGYTSTFRLCFASSDMRSFDSAGVSNT